MFYGLARDCEVVKLMSELAFARKHVKRTYKTYKHTFCDKNLLIHPHTVIQLLVVKAKVLNTLYIFKDSFWVEKLSAQGLSCYRCWIKYCCQKPRVSFALTGNFKVLIEVELFEPKNKFQPEPHILPFLLVGCFHFCL